MELGIWGRSIVIDGFSEYR